ncbi:MAG: hypothetical protein R3241_06765 [Rheinheimera sp.]|jgi:hypothetical protein|nr:hypothetical protein [Rheinheimera sp.]
MSLNVNPNLNPTASIATVFAGNEPRRAPQADAQRDALRSELPQGRGVRASSAVIDRLDDERRQQTAFNTATNRRSQQAIDAYQRQAEQPRRSEVQSLLGVDLYA